jgi:hypothetical protein
MYSSSTLGRLPASRLEIRHCTWLLDQVPTSFVQFSEKFRTWTPTIIGERQSRVVHSHFIGREELLAAVHDPLHRLVVCGIIVYRDMFSDEERQTNFCFVWDARLDAFYPAGPMNTIT